MIMQTYFLNNMEVGLKYTMRKLEVEQIMERCALCVLPSET